MEHYLKSKWVIPDKEKGITEIEITIDNTGKIISSKFPLGDNNKWNQSIINVFSQVKDFSKSPPKDFPLKFSIRFDTIEELYEQ